MKTLVSPYSEYRRFYPEFPEGGLFRKQQFCVRTQIDDNDDSSVLFNTLSGEIIALSPEEDRIWCSAPEEGIEIDKPVWKLLASHDFIVPSGTDMMKVLENGRREAVAVQKRAESFISGTSNYTILTTTDCNARCFYCYEKGRSRIRMTDDTALRTAQFIESNYRKNGMKVDISWFGGEPLYNMKAIEIICGYLAEHAIPFSSSMVSNGYLMTEDVSAKAVKEWNLHHIQITLDGTEETYNRCKAFIYPESEGSPFRRVMNNIISMARNGLKVSIRMNVDSHNFDNLMTLAGNLAEIIAGDETLRKNISAYCHPLFEDNTHPNYEDRSVKVAGFDIALSEKLDSLGLGGEKHDSGNLIGNGPSLHYCMTDSPFSFVILPDGHLGKCEHYTEDHFVGHIDGNIDYSAIKEMAAFRSYSEECRNCPFPPLCHPVEVCNDFEKGRCITNITTRRAKTDGKLKKTYQNLKNKAKATPPEITFRPKVREETLRDSPLEIISISHCEYAVHGRNGNTLSISFVSALEMGSHSIQAVRFNQTGDRRKFAGSDPELLKSIAVVAEGYLREHPGDLLMMCAPADSRNRAVQRFIGMNFDKFGYGDDFIHLPLTGQERGEDGKKYVLSVFLSVNCPSFNDVKDAVLRQVDKMIEHYLEINFDEKK